MWQVENIWNIFQNGNFLFKKKAEKTVWTTSQTIKDVNYRKFFTRKSSDKTHEKNKKFCQIWNFLTMIWFFKDNYKQ